MSSEPARATSRFRPRLRWSAILLLCTAAVHAAPAGAQRIPPLPRRLTTVAARLYEPVPAPAVDPFGYPANDVDKIRLIALLEAGEHEALEGELRRLHESVVADIRNEYRLSSAYFTFDRTDATMGALLDRWVAATGSVEAHLARAKHRTALAWQSRGFDFMARTTPEQRAGMMRNADMAGEDVAAAAALEPDHLMTYDLAFDVLQFGGWSDRLDQLLQQALDVYPLSASLRESALDVARPAWGGSWEIMDAIAAGAASRAHENPRLAAIRGYTLAERGRLAFVGDDLPAAVHYYTQALEHGADPQFLVGRGEAWLEAKDYTRALADFTDAAVMIPQSPDLLELRTRTLFQIAQFAPADIRDQLLARAFETVTLLKDVEPERENVDSLVSWIAQVRAACLARAPQCRGSGGP